jgi:hypothetical protein
MLLLSLKQAVNYKYLKQFSRRLFKPLRYCFPARCRVSPQPVQPGHPSPRPIAFRP